MVDADHTVTAGELPNFILLLPMVNDLKHVIGESPSIDRAKHIRAFIDQSNKNDHLKFPADQCPNCVAAHRGAGPKSAF
ncbi:hypothetical protein D3C81_2021730 [compost metagenome]